MSCPRPFPLPLPHWFAAPPSRVGPAGGGGAPRHADTCRDRRPSSGAGGGAGAGPAAVGLPRTLPARGGWRCRGASASITVVRPRPGRPDGRTDRRDLFGVTPAPFRGL
ncbi:hypothetical protein NL676_028388 [Syzygium grande]|nr:hypothetical protein NL676_028388 [Syzygium grande]